MQQVLDSLGSETDLGGIKEVIFEVHGRGAYSRLKWEGGGHRVQRVPATEAQGRIHTSAATVSGNRGWKIVIQIQSYREDQQPNVGYDDAYFGKEILPCRHVTDGCSDRTPQNYSHKEIGGDNSSGNERDVKPPPAQNSSDARS